MIPASTAPAMAPRVLPPLWSVLILLTVATGCAGGGTNWDALSRPRPAPLDGAYAVMVEGIDVLGVPRESVAGIPPKMALEELVAAGLLRRRDVHYLDRRRFMEAVRREEAGTPRPAGAPPIGTTESAQVLLTGTWWTDLMRLSLRLVDVETGEILLAGNLEVPADADPISVARVVVGWLTQGLEERGQLPDWNDPVEGAAPPSYTAAQVPPISLEHFLRGIQAEDRYDWEAARDAYVAARESAGGRFLEADAALARVGRMRAGRTLGVG